MTKQLARRCTTALIRNGVVTKKDEALVSFGFELVNISMVGVFLLIAVSIFASSPWAWIAYLAGFAPLRTTAGGYHAKSKLSCYVISTLTYVASLLLAFNLQSKGANIAISIFALICILLLSPIEANNKPLNVSVRKRNRKASIFIGVFNLAVASILAISNWSSIWTQIFYNGVLSATISLVAARITKCGKEE